MATKTLLAYLIMNYDLKLRDDKPPAKLSWRTNKAPMPTNKILIRTRQ